MQVKDGQPVLECPRCRHLIETRSINLLVGWGYPAPFACEFCTVELTIPRRAWNWATAAAFASALLVVFPIIWFSAAAWWGIFAAWLPAVVVQEFVGRSVALKLTDHLVALRD
jgi:hypothetical protein